MKTLASEYASYREQVVPANAGPHQAKEARRAFYAGAAAMFSLIQEAASDPEDEATADDIARMEAIHQELVAFSKDPSR